MFNTATIIICNNKVYEKMRDLMVKSPLNNYIIMNPLKKNKLLATPLTVVRVPIHFLHTILFIYRKSTNPKITKLWKQNRAWSIHCTTISNNRIPTRTSVSSVFGGQWRWVVTYKSVHTLTHTYIYTYNKNRL